MALERIRSTKTEKEKPQTQSSFAAFLFSENVFYMLVAFRLCNALTTRTFFQPDEYFQSLEPAWDLAFGESGGAWITWEWREQLRSSIHPSLFAGVYRMADFGAGVLALEPDTRAEVLIAAPKALQAVFAALTDYFVWRLARQVFGKSSTASTATLLLTVLSPWQWFCATRTLSNSLETTLTTVALFIWPFRTSPYQGVRDDLGEFLSYHARVRVALALAAVATVLRPTNAIIWVVIASYTAINASNYEPKRIIVKLLQECREAVISGSIVLAISALSDHAYYTTWTFPPARFVHFNVVQSLAVFYGRNRGDYYITEGLPLLLTTALPFAIVGTWQSFLGHTGRQTEQTTRPLALTVVVFTAIMSVISHKEVRFIYPLLPALLLLAAEPFAIFFSTLPFPRSLLKKTALLAIVAANVGLAFYISQIHQRGVVDVTHYLRHEHEAKNTDGGTARDTTAMFLMPCHSTPWRSHLVYPGIRARALTCEPPIHVPIEARGQYLDEADQFYEDPVAWMGEHMEARETIGRLDAGTEGGAQKQRWPEYLVFFEQLAPTMEGFLKGTQYTECWKGFNTHWHDDWRREGDVVVWCLR